MDKSIQYVAIPQEWPEESYREKIKKSKSDFKCLYRRKKSFDKIYLKISKIKNIDTSPLFLLLKILFSDAPSLFDKLNEEISSKYYRTEIIESIKLIEKYLNKKWSEIK